MDMNAEQLNEALEHDIARKAQGASQVIVHPGVTPTRDDVGAIEIRQAYLAKAVSLSYVDTAHACSRLAMAEVQGVSLEGDMGKPQIPDVERVEMLLNMAERSVKIAKDLDILGDKALLRYEDEGPQSANPQPTEQ